METEKKRSKWTDWTEISYVPGVLYKTNFKKVRVKLVANNVVAESCCCRDDTFKLAFGIRMAFLRCLVKANEKAKIECENAYDVWKIDKNIEAVKMCIQEMIDSLDAKE